MDPHDQYIFVVAAIENDQFTFARYLLMDSPQKVVVEFVWSGSLEAGYSHALGVDSLEDTADSSVFTTGVDRLEDDQHRVLMLSVEQFLNLH